LNFYKNIQLCRSINWKKPQIGSISIKQSNEKRKKAKPEKYLKISSYRGTIWIKNRQGKNNPVMLSLLWKSRKYKHIKNCKNA